MDFMDVRMQHHTLAWYIFMIYACLRGKPRRSQSKAVVTVYLQCAPHTFSCQWTFHSFILFFFHPSLPELHVETLHDKCHSKSICIKKVECVCGPEKRIYGTNRTQLHLQPRPGRYNVQALGWGRRIIKTLFFPLHWLKSRSSRINRQYKHHTHTNRKCSFADSINGCGREPRR